MNKYSVLFISVLLLITSCKKETVLKTETIYEDSEFSWKPANSINSKNKYVTNCYWDDEAIQFSTSNTVLRYVNGEIINQYYAAELFNRKRALSSNYFTEFTQSAFWIKSWKNPSMNRAIFSTSDERWWMGVGYLYKSLSHVSAINDSENQVLVSVSADSSEVGGVEFVMADFEEGSFLINIEQHLIRVTEENNLLDTYFVDSYFDRFFAGTSHGLLIIEPDRTWRWAMHKQHFIVFHQMFKANSNLYAVEQHTIHISTDQGLNWTPMYETTNNLVGYDFHVFDSLVVVTKNDKLGHFVFDESGMEIIPLKSDGLEFNTITDMGLHNDTVYVTTKSGTFFKRLEDLIEYE